MSFIFCSFLVPIPFSFKPNRGTGGHLPSPPGFGRSVNPIRGAHYAPNVKAAQSSNRLKTEVSPRSTM